MQSYESLINEMQKEFPKFVLLEKKSSTLMKIIDVFLKIITLGHMSTFMTKFITTVGYKVYTPPGWETMDKIGILRHERVHMRQMRKYGRIWFTLSYLFLPLPTVLAYYRKKYEQEAYEETIRYVAERYGILAAERAEFRENIINHFTGAQYFWTWPWRDSIAFWFDDIIEDIKLAMLAK
jgi:hypothetical protein